MIYGRALDLVLLITHPTLIYPDPFVLGVEVAWGLTVFCELVCPLLVMLGIATRLTALPPALSVLIAGLLVPKTPTWAQQELALLYALPFLVLVVTGAGGYTFDTSTLHRNGDL